MRLLHIQPDACGGESLDISLSEPDIREEVLEYAILSHCWRDEEVLFADMLENNSAARTKKGYQKIVSSCKIALAHGLQYLWCDTCCIDKSSSAELSEAINSMYKYYENSEVCIAYLDDVEYAPHGDLCFHQAKWFTRGWTLQELVAPEDVHFYSKEWQFLGTKESLLDHVTSASGVHEDVLRFSSNLRDICVSEKLSWAAKRTTKRPEDRAYSLMGLFGIYMPPLHVYLQLIDPADVH
jgi:hypothetical protein